jgi:hypothetical protein
VSTKNCALTSLTKARAEFRTSTAYSEDTGLPHISYKDAISHFESGKCDVGGRERKVKTA